MIEWPNDWFEQFWKFYPRRIARKAAWNALYKVMRNREVEFDKLIQAVQNFAAHVRGKDVQYIPHPATWINQGRWDDELPTAPQDDVAWRTERVIQETLRRRMQ